MSLGPLDSLNLAPSMPGMTPGPLDGLNSAASGTSAGLGMTPMQRMMLAKGLMGLGGKQQQMPMLDLGNVQGSLPGGGVSSPYGVV